MGYNEATEILDSDNQADAVADLYRWSTNYDLPTPFSLFLDLIGWSADNIGEPLFDLRKASERFGYLELGMLAKALDQYSDYPGPVGALVDKAMQAEAED